MLISEKFSIVSNELVVVTSVLSRQQEVNLFFRLDTVAMDVPCLTKASDLETMCYLLFTVTQL